jgi:glycosyltransferase involved in cell wall biosynthesis
VCFDHQGVGDMVDSSCGVKIAVTSPKRAYKDWANAIESLASDPDRLFALSYGATERAERFLWDKNHKRINQLYTELIYCRGERPTTADLPTVAELQAVTEVHAL